MKLVIDSSVWLEYLTDSPKARHAEKFINSGKKIFLPALVVYEVYKKIKSERGENVAIVFLAQMERLSEPVIPIDMDIAIKAADISLEHKIPMADAVIYATSHCYNATLVSMDTHFKGLPAVEII